MDRRSALHIICLAGIPFVAIMENATWASEDEAPGLDRKTEQSLSALKISDPLTLVIQFHGEQEKPFYRVTLTTKAPPAASDQKSFNRWNQVERPAMLQLINGLAKDGFLARATDVSRKDFQAPKGYSLTLIAESRKAQEYSNLGWATVRDGGYVELFESLGWELSTIKRLERVRDLIEGDAAKSVELLLGRLSGLKKQWEAEQRRTP